MNGPIQAEIDFNVQFVFSTDYNQLNTTHKITSPSHTRMTTRA